MTTRIYLRCSTDKQDERAQRSKIAATFKNLTSGQVEWYSDVESGGVAWQQRRLADVLAMSKAGDEIIVSEVSRIARSTTGVLTFLEAAAEKEVRIECCEPRMTLDTSIGGKVMAFAFGLGAEIERHMMRQRTRSGLAARKAAGVTLGRPVGSMSDCKLADRRERVEELRKVKLSYAAIGRILGASRVTVSKYCKSIGLD